MIDIIKTNDDEIMAIVIRHDYDKNGITFFTPDDFSQQLAFMHHPKGHRIKAHIHNLVKREVLYTKEVLVIRKGKLRCDFYSNDRVFLESIIIESGDVLLLASGGHGFECLEETEMYEIKQGPYAGDNDKIVFGQ